MEFQKKIIIEKLKSEVHVSSERSSGAGGQNVNKTNSKAFLSWDFQSSTILTDAQKKRFSQYAKNKINEEEIYTHSHQTERSLYLNTQIGFEYLADLLEKIWRAPKKRIATKPTLSSKIKRVEKKRTRSDVKKNRQKIKI